MRKEVPIGIGFVVGVLILLEYFFGSSWASLGKLSIGAQEWASIIAAFGMGLAVVNVAVVHGRNIRQKRKGAWLSWFVFAGMLVMFVPGLFPKGTAMNSVFTFFLNGFYQRLGSATYSMLVFFLASAARRSFRARNVDSAFLLIAGFMVMLGNAPVGEALSSWFPAARTWLMNVPNVAGNRAILIAGALAIVATSVRTLLGIERSYFGGQ